MMLANWLNLYANVSFQFALLGGIVWLITRFRPFRSAPIQYMLWTICLLSLFILPFLNLLLPAFSVPRIATESNDVQSKVSALTTTVAEVKDDSMPSLPISKNRTIESARPFPWYQIVFGVWLAGSIWSAVRLFAGLYQLRRLRKRSLLVTDTAILQQLDRLCQQAQVRSQVTLLADSTMPFSFGWRKFYIVLPKTLLQSSAEKPRELVLLHELAHLKRRDGLIKFIENLFGVFIWFHPFYHLSCVSLHRCREQICDDWVLRWTRRVADYAQCLTDLLVFRGAHDGMAYSLSLMQDRSWLQRRVFYLLDRRQPRRLTLSKWERIGTIGLLVLLIPFLAIAQLFPVVNVWAQTPQQAQISFISTRDGNWEVYIMDTDGKNSSNLTNHPANDGVSSWSPDGQRIAFFSDRDKGNGEIYIMDADGKNPRNLTNHPAWDAVPSWSPDGRKIAFISHRDGNSEIYVIDSDGKNPRRLTDHPGSDGSPSWSRDSRKIAFSSDRDGGIFNTEIYVMDADGKNVRRLTNFPGFDGSPSWSPDGRKLAFAHQPERETNWDIHIMDANGENVHRLTDHPARDIGPVWSPNGQRIAFSSNRDGNYKIYMMDTDGKNILRLTNHPADDFVSDWFDPEFALSISPAGKHVTIWGRIKQLAASLPLR